MNTHNQAERALHNMVAVSSTATVCMQADADAERLTHIMSDDRKDVMKSNQAPSAILDPLDSFTMWSFSRSCLELPYA